MPPLGVIAKVQMPPLLQAPPSWPHNTVALAAMTVLAALDFLGAVLAKEWALRGDGRLLLAGLATFAALFYVYASSLSYADLATVTFGWVALLQVGLLSLDRLRYGVSIPTGKWVAVAVLLGSQAYLLLGPAPAPKT